MRRTSSLCVVIAWLCVMALVIHHSYIRASASLATDLARYGSSAQWRGVYYRGEKVGFTVSQTVSLSDRNSADDAHLELQEDGQLQMSLLGAHIVTKIRTTARVNRS